MVEEEREDRIALLLAQADDSPGEARVDVQGLLAGDRVATDDGVDVLDRVAANVAAVSAGLRAGDLLEARVNLEQERSNPDQRQTRRRENRDGRTASSPSRKAWTGGDSRAYASR
jgi:hypothetical protein